MKTAGVPEHQWTFSGPAKVAESQDEAVEMILGGKIVEVAKAERLFTAPADPRTAAFISGEYVC